MKLLPLLLLAVTVRAQPTLETVMSFGGLGSGRHAGSLRTENGQTRYSLVLDVALEQFQNEKRDRARDHQWFLRCESPTHSGRAGTSCRLARTVFDYWDSGTNLGTVCQQTEHTTADGTLELRAADWSAGELDFNILHGDDSKTHVLMDLAYEGSVIILKSLTASITSRSAFGRPTTLEFRVPEFTHVQQVPIVMNGMKPAWEKEWGKTIRKLSTTDQAVADRLLAVRHELVGRVLEQLQRSPASQPNTTTPDAERRASEEAGANFIVLVEEWLSKSDMSAKGRKTIVDFLRSH